MEGSSLTLLTVNYNTPNLLTRLVTSFRKYYELPILVVDGSDEPNYQKIKSLGSQTTRIVHFDSNVGHGPGICYGIENIETDQILLVDSDSYFIAHGLVEELQSHMDEKTYGVGWIMDLPKGIKYIHPCCVLLNRRVALQWPLPVQDGAPLLKPMAEISRRKKTKILKHFGNNAPYFVHEWNGTGGEGSWPYRKKNKDDI
jgi:glycosyltransferase involved in cell wall biosynthesis